LRGVDPGEDTERYSENKKKSFVQRFERSRSG
jgi:hypothetical protein